MKRRLRRLRARTQAELATIALTASFILLVAIAFQQIRLTQDERRIDDLQQQVVIPGITDVQGTANGNSARLRLLEQKVGGMDARDGNLQAQIDELKRLVEAISPGSTTPKPRSQGGAGSGGLHGSPGPPTSMATAPASAPLSAPPPSRPAPSPSPTPCPLVNFLGICL